MGATPFDLMPDQNHTWLVMLQESLALFESDPVSFLERFLIQDKLGPPLQARNKTTVKEMETPLFSCSKVSQGGVDGREGDGLRLLGRKGDCVH